MKIQRSAARVALSRLPAPLGLGTAALLIPLAAVLGGAGRPGNAVRWGFEGSWVGVNSVGVHTLETATPLSPDGARVAIVASSSSDPTFGGAFPEATHIGPYFGEARRSGPNSFGFRTTAVGADAQGQVVYFLENSGAKQPDICGAARASGQLAIYLAAQDGDGDGQVDDGETPVGVVAYTCRLLRVAPAGS